MKKLKIWIALSAIAFSSGCLQTTALVVQAAAQTGTLYLQATKPTQVVRSAECGEIEPIYPEAGWNDRLTEDEKNQIAEQAIRLSKLCGGNYGRTETTRTE